MAAKNKLPPLKVGDLVQIRACELQGFHKFETCEKCKNLIFIVTGVYQNLIEVHSSAGNCNFYSNDPDINLKVIPATKLSGVLYG